MVFQQLFAVLMKATAVDLPRLLIVARQQDPAFAERLNVVVLAPESLALVLRKLSYAFLISIHWNYYLSSDFTAMLSDVRSFLPI